MLAIRSALQKAATFALLLAGLLYGTTALALGLGDIDVSSKLNERFRAEIPLVNEGRLDTSQILVKLGAARDFERAGIDRPYFLTSIQFKIEDSDKGKVLKLSTPDVLREPFLNFIIEVRWPSGRTSRVERCC